MTLGAFQRPHSAYTSHLTFQAASPLVIVYRVFRCLQSACILHEVSEDDSPLAILHPVFQRLQSACLLDSTAGNPRSLSL
jgi:hypothetical protein